MLRIDNVCAKHQQAILNNTIHSGKASDLWASVDVMRSTTPGINIHAWYGHQQCKCCRVLHRGCMWGVTLRMRHMYATTRISQHHQFGTCLCRNATDDQKSCVGTSSSNKGAHNRVVATWISDGVHCWVRVWLFDERWIEPERNHNTSPQKTTGCECFRSPGRIRNSCARGLSSCQESPELI